MVEIKFAHVVEGGRVFPGEGGVRVEYAEILMAKEHERLSRQVAGYHRVVLGSTCGQVQAETASSVSAKGSSTPRILCCWILPSVCSGATVDSMGAGDG